MSDILEVKYVSRNEAKRLNPINKKKDETVLEKYVKTVYLNEKTGYRSTAKILTEVRKKYPDAEPKQVRKILMQIEGFDSVMPRKFKFPKREYFISENQTAFSELSADLADFKPFIGSKSYLFILIDNLTRYTFARLIHSKEAKTILNEFHSIKDEIKELRKTVINKLNEERKDLIKSNEDIKDINDAIIFAENPDNFKIHRLQVDRGTEFNLLKKENDLIVIHSNSDHAFMAERVIRTLKNLIIRYMRHNKSLNFTNETLQNLVENYNNTRHSVIKMTPFNAVCLQEELRKNLRKQQKEFNDKLRKEPKYELDTIVKISRNRETFDKEQNNNWSDTLFRIVYRESGNPPIYHIEALIMKYDKDDNLRMVELEPIKGIFYEQELLQIE